MTFKKIGFILVKEFFKLVQKIRRNRVKSVLSERCIPKEVLHHDFKAQFQRSRDKSVNGISFIYTFYFS